KLLTLVEVVSQQAGRTHSQVGEDCRGEGVVTPVGGEAEHDVGVDRVIAAILQVVSANLMGQPDAPPLIAANVDQDSPAFGGQPVLGKSQLRPTVAAAGAEHVPGQALRVDTDQDVLAVADVTENGCDDFTSVGQ